MPAGDVRKPPVARTGEPVHLSASQINGCGVCVEMHARDLKRGDETNERLFAVGAWRKGALEWV